MLIEENKFVFGKYLEQYGIYDENLLEYVGFKDDAPDEAKNLGKNIKNFVRKCTLKELMPKK